MSLILRIDLISLKNTTFTFINCKNLDLFLINYSSKVEIIKEITREYYQIPIIINFLISLDYNVFEMNKKFVKSQMFNSDSKYVEKSDKFQKFSNPPPAERPRKYNREYA